ncbi:metallophosphoesterase family protein [Zobellia galactanivorans]|uniref:metallophosphoesterase family protein n=1 Tax=Zobellia galactanivorans (strain DSM 12802 / CCUG 47099 / CIP 106680 / NCIMB 13871 / Dsij) TaxID=63186 RepID=UPI001C074F84|nr:metallophosphoesterase family protein [Zobellia galactanivorans]MBU3027994.1 serine/threonine protein phosphatase [Zobellia galactanivorans]
MRTFVVGDIHSGLKGLKQVFERAGVTPDDQLIFLGDYVDGWSEAVETVDFLIELGNSHNCIFIRGNHDELCLEWLRDGKDNPLWLQHGGGATLASYEKADAQTKRNHIQFYEGLKNHYVDSNKRLFLHAGFTNLKGIEYEYFKQTFYWDRTLWELARSLNPKLERSNPDYPKRLAHYKEIFIGHTPISKTTVAQPTRAANVWNVDTGAAFKGPLSMLDIDSKTIFQSDPVHQLYPGEPGRN